MKTGLERIGAILVLVLVGAAAALVFYLGFRPASAPDPEKLEKSVLTYSACSEDESGKEICATPETIPCLVEDQYEEFLTRKRRESDMRLVLTAHLDDGRKMEIYRAGDADFIAMMIGPDKMGMTEACQIAAGKALKWVGDEKAGK